MRILITGSTGFIGQAVVHQLVSLWQTASAIATDTLQLVLPMDDCSNVRMLMKSPWHLPNVTLTTLAAELRQPSAVDLVIHLAANNDTQSDNATAMRYANVHLPTALFVGWAQQGCREFVYASSAAVYGKGKPDTAWKETATTRPVTAYGESKLAFEQAAADIASRFRRNKPLKMIGLRFSNVYGPGEQHKGFRCSMIGQMLQQAIKKQPVSLFRPGLQSRDWVYVQDAAAAVLRAVAVHGSSVTKNSLVCNVGSGQSYSFRHILDNLVRPLHPGTAVKWLDCSFPDTYQDFTKLDLSLSRRVLKYKPVWSLEKGVAAYNQHLLSSLV